jgi:addiction module HigA family antidote
MTRPVKPGVALLREIHARNWTQTKTAELLGWADSELSCFVSGSRRVTEKSAIDLARVIGTSTEFWLNLEAKYRENLANKMPPVKGAQYLPNERTNRPENQSQR